MINRILWSLFYLSLSLLSLIPILGVTQHTLYEPIVYWFFSTKAEATVLENVNLNHVCKPPHCHPIYADVKIRFFVNDKAINATIIKYTGKSLFKNQRIDIRYATFDSSLVMTHQTCRLFLIMLIPNLILLFIFSLISFMFFYTLIKGDPKPA